MNRIITKDRTVEVVALFALDRLGVDGVTVTVAKDERLLGMMSGKDYALLAMTCTTAVPHAYRLVTGRAALTDDIICHEMVHVAQQEDGRLEVDSQNNLFRWKGQEYRPDALPYFSFPWEKEAYGRQGGLVKAYRLNNRKRQHGII